MNEKKDLDVTELVGRIILVKDKDGCATCGRGNELHPRTVLDISVNREAILIGNHFGGGSKWVEVSSFNKEFEIVDATKNQIQKPEHCEGDDALEDDEDDEDEDDVNVPHRRMK